MNLLILAVSIGFAGILSGCGGKAESTARLRTAAVERGDMTQTVIATGRVRSLYQIEIRSKSGGTVRKFYVEEGDRVKKGDRLFEITPEASPTEQVRAREALRKANVAVMQAEDDLRIAEELWDKKLIPEQDLRNTRREVERAQAGLSAAEAEWGLFQPQNRRGSGSESAVFHLQPGGIRLEYGDARGTEDVQYKAGGSWVGICGNAEPNSG